jgi:hypothetical protein
MTELFGGGQQIPNKCIVWRCSIWNFPFHFAELFIRATELRQHAAVPLEI